MPADGMWPEKPYRGLNYLRREDRPLLAGRDEDVAACTELLAHPETRVLMLHGATGCGKSSFMRAGLIPSLEAEGAGFEFLRRDATEDESMFIRCTASPVAQIAAHLYTFSGQAFRLRTPAGNRSLDLGAARLGAASLERYLGLVKDEEGALFRSLEAIAAAIPQTPVLIVDQSEEVLTLNPGQEGVQDRVRFFEFLRAFQRTRQDARIVVALRTEYLGRFLDAVQVGYRQSAGYRHYFLNELSPEALEEAIIRPTRRNEVPPWGAPYEVYGFEFEPALPVKIAGDVLAAKYSGPALPVLQLVCLGLYESGRRESGAFRIGLDDYLATGEAQGLIVAHIQKSLRTALATEKMVSQVRNVLTRLYLMQDDGTVVAYTRTRQWARDELGKTLSEQGADALLEQLARPETLVLRLLHNVEPDGSIVEKVTLGHDSIALAIERWRALDAEIRAAEAEQAKKEKDALEERRYGVAILCVFVVLIVVLLFPGSRSRALALPVSTYQSTVRTVLQSAPTLFSYWVPYLLAVVAGGIAAFYVILFALMIPGLVCYGAVALFDSYQRTGVAGFRHQLLRSAWPFRM